MHSMNCWTLRNFAKDDVQYESFFIISSSSIFVWLCIDQPTSYTAEKLELRFQICMPGCLLHLLPYSFHPLCRGNVNEGIVVSKYEEHVDQQ